MIVSLNWLRRYVDFDLDAVELALRLTSSLTEAEALPAPWRGVRGVVAARVVTVDRHPEAERLSVCVVDWGAGSSTVVCGAPNVRAGMTSVLAPPGAVIAGGRRIEEVTLRGRRSQGMLVSAQELGLEESSDGILELPDVEPGTDVTSLLGLDDEIIDLDVQANRPDCLGMIGVAREVAALTGAELRTPAMELREEGAPASEAIEIEVEDPEGCPRYIGRVVRGVRTGPSPPWLAAALRSVGVRSISNVVDVTNFVMLEYGHPIHAFDLDVIRDGKIIVRRAKQGEVMVTLDGLERTLDAEHLLICDGRGPVALAGVMGGAESEVSKTTKNILLECAWFDPVVVRRGAWKLGLRTEASQRFERGVDPKAMDAVAGRACALMSELAGGKVAPGAVDVGTDGGDPPTITLRVDRVTSMLGEDVGTEETVAALRGFGFGVERAEEGSLAVAVPSHRSDVTVEADLIEEVLRARGYDRVVPEVPFHSLDAAPDTALATRERVREAMVGLGFYEVLTTSFTGERVAERMRGWAAPGEPVVLTNPVNKEMPLMRTAVLPSLLDVVRRNGNVGEKDLRLFEVGRIFWKGEEGCRERWSLAGAMTGLANRRSWGREQRGVDFYDMKGALAGLCEALDIDTFETPCYDGPLLDGEASSWLTVQGEKLGGFGALSKPALAAWEFAAPVFVFEMDLDRLCALVPTGAEFAELPKYPKARRDVALVVGERAAAGDVLAEVRALGEPLLVDAELFDIYRGEQLPAGRKSLAFALTYMSRERTLTDEEVDEAHSRIVEHLKERFDAELR